MKTTRLEEILQKHYVHDRGLNNPQYVIEAVKEYARECCVATQKKCAENAQVSGTHPSRGKKPYVGKSIFANHEGWEVVADKDSITNPENIVFV